MRKFQRTIRPSRGRWLIAIALASLTVLGCADGQEKGDPEPLLNCSPFLKFDGYWFVSDSLGIHDLHGYVLDWIGLQIGAAGHGRSSSYPTSWYGAGIVIYVLLFVLFAACLLVLLVGFIMRVNEQFHVSSLSLADWVKLVFAGIVLLSMVRQVFNAFGRK